ncbi:DUF6702 family protein [Winogradskyella schleiferi]|uniref:DUF6702 family protein n=1 Tax=Winogradskyella schleiferi TaxID=2686078 RepID=UPI0015BE0E5E|nr:DUF6702 family protein [Winogradskyella schleiferi]
MKSISLIIAFLSLPFLTSSTYNHEYYVGVTQIEYSKEAQSLQIISQVFTDDFETLLRKRYNENITLDPDSDDEVIDNYMERYMTDKLKFKVNGNNVNFKFLGKEYKEDITYCYLEIEHISEIKSIEVTNQLLFDAFSEQQNIVRLKLLNKNKSFLLVPENDSCMLNFK